jgi:hypothetical protein|tara:strand:+ start:350 stop:502 length:153 start_codon:yes stop_codon:yes gene_type:complete
VGKKKTSQTKLLIKEKNQLRLKKLGEKLRENLEKRKTQAKARLKKSEKKY